MRNILFDSKAFKDFVEWSREDKVIFKKIANLIHETARTPFEGSGKPEPLRNELSGYWSRRINKRHRLVYRVEKETIVIIACRYHYSK